ncbi:prephenate dehydratase [Parashewanella spongiae]|uniref:prephenate dehydratase n=1 Tax=Parashewanella spongiae TaxID=342950 RepID=A0A3A6U1H7_9GAMM|nr:prephenate dehydratase [Parashewanella spongiae]MCL1078958.1 prephenate dehydratase [Parashewanella spongiae]RJY15204.1 prephenate dehydratase [Parashewanella spongiae]
MQTIATLGPSGTYTEQATIQFIHGQALQHEIQYFSSLLKVIDAVGKGCQLGVVPIENFSEGFVSPVLDALAQAQLHIVAEILLPIQFSFVSNEADFDAIKQIYVQFVAKNQCSKFLSQFEHLGMVQTQSNMASLQQLQNNLKNSAAIVPSNAVMTKEFSSKVTDVGDYPNNQTRFVVLSADKHFHVNELTTKANRDGYKTSLVISSGNDSPGALSQILNSFAEHSVNLLSIISRPTCESFGDYWFFIDLEGAINNVNISDAISKIEQDHQVKVLGSYTCV